MSQSKTAIVAACLRLDIWYSQIITMPFQHNFIEELRWRVIGRFSSVTESIWASQQCQVLGPQVGVYKGSSAKDGHSLPRVLMTDICHYAHEGIEPQLRLNSNPLSLQVRNVGIGINPASKAKQTWSLCEVTSHLRPAHTTP
ncbi:hypothetical protein TNCV_805281 [Trichonephila clavipes]|nr:hypothetical protein TNCV_805281 [Trichonephila clavipes]